MIKNIFIVFIILNYCTLAQTNVELLGQLNEHSSAGYSDIWGYAAPDGNEYALLAVKTGTSIINVTNPQNPVEIDFIPGPFSSWRDIKTHSHYAYVVTEGTDPGRGLQIIDLSHLPDSAQLVNTVDSYFNSAHNIFIDDGYAFAIGTNNGGGMHILDLSDPVNPIRTNYYTGSGYIHDVYVWDDTVIACAGSSQSYHLIDITDKSNPVKISESAPLPGIYAHSGWMTEDKRYFVAAEEFNQRDITIWDLKDRTSWDLVIPSWQMPTNSTVHNIFIKDNYAHISYYSEGYVVLDISKPEFPQLVGQYDVSTFESGFRGAWGCYPFLPSGNILISSMEQGLFVLKFNPPAFIPDSPPLISHQKIEGDYLSVEPVNIMTNISDNNAVVNAVLYYRTIKNEIISEWISVIDQSGPTESEYNFIIPGQQHLTEVEYYIAAIDDSNNVSTNPAGGSGTNPVGNNPPPSFISYRVIIPGVPVINSFSPANNSIAIPKNGSVTMNVIASDTSGLNLTYKWFRNSALTTIVSQSYTYGSPQFLPAPRTDTVTVIISNDYNSVSLKWFIHIENTTGVDDKKPLSFNLSQNYPNPFNPSTEINFSIPKSEMVNLSVYNLIGQKVAVLINEVLPAGSYTKTFNAANFTSGIYIAKIISGNYQKMIKMTLIK